MIKQNLKEVHNSKVNHVEYTTSFYNGEGRIEVQNKKQNRQCYHEWYERPGRELTYPGLLSERATNHATEVV